LAEKRVMPCVTVEKEKSGPITPATLFNFVLPVGLADLVMQGRYETDLGGSTNFAVNIAVYLDF
jgi:hypothetical protein